MLTIHSYWFDAINKKINEGWLLKWYTKREAFLKVRDENSLNLIAAQDSPQIRTTMRIVRTDPSLTRHIRSDVINFTWDIDSNRCCIQPCNGNVKFWNKDWNNMFKPKVVPISYMKIYMNAKVGGDKIIFYWNFVWYFQENIDNFPSSIHKSYVFLIIQRNISYNIFFLDYISSF